VAGLNIDGGRIETNDDTSRPHYNKDGFNCYGKYDDFVSTNHSKGRFPANIILDEEAAKLLDEQSGVSGSGKMVKLNRKRKGFMLSGSEENIQEANAPDNYGDKGGASRFFKNIKVEKQCSLCYTTYSKAYNKESKKWKNIFVRNAEKNGWTTKVITEFIAQINVIGNQNEKLVQNVKSAGNLCDLCGMFIAVALVGIKTLDFNQEILQVILGYITNYKRCILIQNLVSFAGLWENIDTIPTIQSLSLLFGSVNHAITNYIPETKKSEITRFIYTPKASKKERNRGCEGLEEQVTQGMRNNAGPALVGENYNRTKLKNHHPTVKPLSLMKYLVTLTKMPNPEQVYLDPFCGSGTTLMACKELGCNYIGIEKEPEYVDIARKRVNATPEPLFKEVK